MNFLKEKVVINMKKKNKPTNGFPVLRILIAVFIG